jgi:dihydrofolate reductase
MRLTALCFLTLDGIMQSNGKPEPELDDGFEHGGWQVPYIDEEVLELHAGLVATADAFLLGRQTYELFAGHWPHVTDADDPFATRLNSLPKYVASTTLDKVEWNNSTLLRGDVSEEVAELKRRPGRELQIHGSAALVRSLMSYDLIDEFRLYFHPVILGAGQRLFSEGTVPTALRLVDTKTTGSGVVLHIFRPAGKPKHSSVVLEQDGDVVRDSVSGRAGSRLRC